MKITILKNDQPEKEKIDLQDLKPGTVVEYVGGAIGLVINGKRDAKNEVALLRHGQSGDDWFKVAYGFKRAIIEKILGHLVEIVIEEWQPKT